MSDELCDLRQGKCVPCEGGVPPLSDAEADRLLQALPQWHRNGGTIQRVFKFANYYETLAFVNATAWVSHREDHHPVLTVDYNQVTMQYFTHAIGGLSRNDFICAAKIDALLTL